LNNRYEIQCPGCSCALVLPANNDEEVQEFWRMHRESGLAFHCYRCGRVFEGLLERMGNPDDDWGIMVDKNGSRFDIARKRLDELFEVAKGPQYLKGICNTY